ncbi:MAG: hypothetical protein SFY67_04090 [Candidatus Melainabacteria bacterium]|nr:hypothetical protein [Candidatus Melainabacteria bacterium]
MNLQKSRAVLNTLLLATSCLVLPAHSAQKLDIKTLVDEPNTEIYSPIFLRSSSKVAFVKKKHEPDFHEAEAFTDSELRAFRDRSKTDARWGDPEVTLLTDDGTNSIKIDYGWNPEASAKGDRLYYVHQKQPISGKRVLAETQAGNEIYAYDLITKMNREVAAPQSGYFDSPKSHPTQDKITYAICDATNGAYGGSVGVGVYDAVRNTGRTILAPAKHFELYDLVGSPIWMGPNILVSRKTALGKGVWLADSYKFDVLNLSGETPKVIYELKEPVDLVKHEAYIQNNDGKLEVSDNVKTVQIDPDNGKVLKEIAVKTDTEPQGLRSPDNLFEFSKKGKTITIKNCKSGQKLTATISGDIASAVWSPDSKHMLIVMTINKKHRHEEVFDRDRLVKIDLPDFF